MYNGFLFTKGIIMSEENNETIPMLTVDDVEYSVDDLSNSCKIHYVQVLKLRKKVIDLQNHCIEAEEDLVDARVALGWREQALRDSVQAVEEPEVEE